MRRPLALVSCTIVIAGALGASAATPAGTTVTASATKVVTAGWTGTVAPGVDNGGCTTSVGGSDVETLTYKVPSGLLKAVTTSTEIAVQSKANNDVDLLVTDAKGSVLGSSTGSAGTEKVSLTDLAAGTYKVTVCTGTVQGDDYAAKLTITPKARPSTGTPAAAKSLMTFTPATVVDPVLFGGEPGFTYDPTSAGGNARSFVDWPVSSRTMIGVLFRSEDGGLSYTKRYSGATDLAAAGVACFARQVPYCPAGGGGDTDIDINPTTGSVGMGEQESLANQAVGVSLDHGTTFPADHVDPALDKTGSGVDRQWQASWKGTKTRFMAYHVPVLGEFINRSDNEGALGSWTVPGTPQIPNVAQSGSMLADNTGGPLNKTLYIGYLGFPLLPGSSSGFNVGVSTDGAKTFTSHPIPGGDHARSMTTLSLDKAGNLYAVWADSSTQQTYLATSLASDPVNRKAPATKWSKPVVVSQSPLNVTIFANTVAGSAGRVAVGYYGTTAKAATPDAVLPGAGGWKPYVAVSTNALCQWGPTPCTSPTFSQDPISHKVNHDTNICTSGTTCAANPSSNRNLLDYFAIDVDKQGHLGFVWSDTDNATLEPFVKMARQASGPSLFAGAPNASLPQRGNGYPDALGDAKYPIAGAKLLTAANQKALDLSGTVVQRASNGDVVITMSVPKLSSGQGGVLPGNGSAVDDSGTPLQQTRFVTRWDFKGQAYYAEATMSGAEGVVAYGAGAVSSAEGEFNAGNVSATLGNTYAPLTAATGTFPGSRIIIRVPAKAVGSPAKGARLYSVGSYSLIGARDPLSSVQTLPLTVDSTPTMDIDFGKAAANVPGAAPAKDLPRAIGGSGGKKGGSLAATGLPAGVAGGALLMLALAVALRRRVSRA
ncbi:MAG: hypothetical protein JWO12_968 [Frankiales bacterium]|nr:hypothetical protein [Frankiales bacterium]